MAFISTPVQLIVAKRLVVTQGIKKERTKELRNKRTLTNLSESNPTEGLITKLYLEYSRITSNFQEGN